MERMAAIVVIVAGVVLFFKTPLSGRLGGAAWAMWLPIAAALVRGAVQPMVKFAMEGWPNPFAAVTAGYLVSAAVVLAVSAARQRSWPVAPNRAGWLWFSAIGVCNGLAVYCMFQALALGSVTLVAPLVACYPVATLAFGRVMHGAESLDRRTIAGVGVTVVGVVMLLLA
jgi:drug/metabolite transporter (DMT)-like permease